jgi:LAS superfamily LD-carboxypeptidase LdcB
MAVLDQLDPALREAAKYLVRLCADSGLRPVVTSVVRSRKKQEQLYRNYITGRSRLPAAKPGTSKHERRLAFDMTIAHPAGMTVAQLTAYMAPIGEVWEAMGGRWGGRFRDPIHFEAP